MIYTITFNPSLDYVVDIDGFETGKLNRTKQELIFPGGKGINVSMVLSQLGMENTALGFVAGFTGAELQTRLQEKGIHTEFISVEEGTTRINVKLQSAEETEINGQGPLVSEEALNQFWNKMDTLTEEDVLVVSGSVSRGVPQSIYGEIVKLCNEKNIRVIVDASSALLWNTLEHAPFLIKPNQHELGDIFNRDIHSRDEMIFYGKELQNCGARNVLISAGSEGAVLIAEDGEVYDMPAPKGEVLNSVGAGDSMVAGFLYGYLKTESYKEAMKYGICCGSATAFSKGLATREEIEELLQEITKK